ncbi:hypothetical protein [Streptomyces sp. NPDC097619]|uniref:hypothetical protein n=1 Tax=Streptomyces sp. NPDC097619 TaxID=3157228 RepID=UPI003333DCCF
MKRSIAVCAAASVLAGLVAVVAPAATAAAAESAACTPKVNVMGTVADATPGSHDTDAVLALGAPKFAAGRSAGKPVYWTGTTVHRIPLPGPQDTGAVLAVNTKNLMVGQFRSAVDNKLRGFSYKAGDPAVKVLPEAYWQRYDIDVNNSGAIVMTDADGVGIVWKGGKVTRRLALPADSGPGTRLITVVSINNRGDIVGVAEQDHEVPETGEHILRSYPVLWPAGGGPARELPSWARGWTTMETQDLDESGRVVGYAWNGPAYRYYSSYQATPDTPGIDPGTLGTFPYGTLQAISPTTNVSVGTAKYHPEETVLPDQAQYWPGFGPMLALPRLSPNGASGAEAVSDSDRVGGYAVNAKGVRKPTVWTCASAQAYLPQ